VYQTAIGRHGDRTCTAESGAVRNRARYHCAIGPANVSSGCGLYRSRDLRHRITRDKSSYNYGNLRINISFKYYTYIFTNNYNYKI